MLAKMYCNKLFNLQAGNEALQLWDNKKIRAMKLEFSNFFSRSTVCKRTWLILIFLRELKSTGENLVVVQRLLKCAGASGSNAGKQQGDASWYLSSLVLTQILQDISIYFNCSKALFNTNRFKPVWNLASSEVGSCCKMSSSLCQHKHNNPLCSRPAIISRLHIVSHRG